MNSTAFTAVIPLQTTRKITVVEDIGVAGSPTTDYYVLRDLADTPRRIPAGDPYPFDCPTGNWVKGYIAGYIKAVTGSTTFIQDEAWS